MCAYPLFELRAQSHDDSQSEDGLDYGGLSREFFFLLSHEMFNPFVILLLDFNADALRYFSASTASLNTPHMTTILCKSIQT